MLLIILIAFVAVLIGIQFAILMFLKKIIALDLLSTREQRKLTEEIVKGLEEDKNV